MARPTFDSLWLGTAGNTILRFPIPSHIDGTKAVVSVTINGDQTPVPAPPAGWTEQTAAYDANADTTFVVWTHDNLTAAETTIDVTWGATAVAAGTVLVSVDAQSIDATAPVTVVLGTNVATAAATGAPEGYPAIVGGTADGDPKLEPVTDATYTQAEWNDEQQTGVDAWVLWSLDLLTAVAGNNEIQRIWSHETSGTFTLTYDGQTTVPLNWNATALEVETALTALSNIGVGDVDCTEGPLAGDGTEIAIEFTGALANTDVPLITSTIPAYVDGENEVQRVTSDRTGGDFTLTFDGQTTAAINWDASNAQMRSALEALSNINGVITSGGPLPGAIDVEFIANNSETDVPEMTVTDSGTGGTGVSVSTVSDGFPDSGGEVYVDTEGDPGGIPDQNYALSGTGNEAGGASYTTSQLIMFEAAANTGPEIFLNTPNQVGCVTDPVTIAGYATAETGVDTVDVEIIRAADGLYWDGAAWVAGPVSNAATLGTPGGQSTTFTYDASGAFTQAGSYTIQITATDLDAPPIANSIAVTTCVDGPTAVQLSRSGTKLGDGGRIMVEVVGRPNGVSPGVVIARLNVAKDESYFTRRLDSTSEAEVVARYAPLDLRRCCDVLGSIETYAHELRIWWDGIPAWVGPITHTRHLVDGIHIRAADRTVHWETRVIGAHTHDNVPLSTIFADYQRDAYAQDPFDLTVIVQDVNISGSRLVLVSDGMVAERALSELSRTAIDWTCVGTQLLIGGQEVPTRAVPTLTDEHFTEPLEVVEDGTLRATDFVMTGGNNINDTTTNLPVSGRATLPATDPRRRRYGLITGRSQDSKIIDQESINAAARTRLEFGQDPVYVDTREGVLRPSAPVQMVDLIPGARVDAVAMATCKQVATKFRIWRVRARLNGQVQIEFQPLGTTAPGTI